MNGDLESIFQMNELLNRAGMDTISVGGTIAFASGVLRKGHPVEGGERRLELTWGNSEAMIALVEKMIRREGIGDILADGSRAAAEKIGRGTPSSPCMPGGRNSPCMTGVTTPGSTSTIPRSPHPGGTPWAPRCTTRCFSSGRR